MQAIFRAGVCRQPLFLTSPFSLLLSTSAFAPALFFFTSAKILVFRRRILRVLSNSSYTKFKVSP
jgi:hypothetical protein